MRLFLYMFFFIWQFSAWAQLHGADVDVRFSQYEKQGVNMNQKLEYSFFFYSNNIESLNTFYKSKLKSSYALVKIQYKSGYGFFYWN